ncbi:hypothetical protein F0U44_17705 [Nocardioides humilatus]|uniref:Uncharacterized protein n=1 Tax=Nocardioides humilatus TaxID=2607660 RepID=A0A5B1L8V1_9ACTN|nr:hypothetical protein [Nocardioides humilatus]KAA1417015.1 hypothetical protein F0U44_17705 [Nocardioides humilatus]
MIDTFSATILAVVVGCAVVAAISRIRGHSTQATRWALTVSLCGGVLLLLIDWWSIGGNLGFADEAEIGGMSRSIHRMILIAILGWSVVVAGVSAVRPARAPDRNA